MDVFEVLVIVERALDNALALEKLFHVEHTLGSETYTLGFLIQHVIALGLQFGAVLEACKCADYRIFAGFGVLFAFLEVLRDALCIAGLVGIVIGLA